MKTLLVIGKEREGLNAHLVRRTGINFAYGLGEETHRWFSACAFPRVPAAYERQTVFISYRRRASARPIKCRPSASPAPRRPPKRAASQFILECGDLSPLSAGDLSPSKSEARPHVHEPLERGSALPTSRQSEESGDESLHSKSRGVVSQRAAQTLKWIPDFGRDILSPSLDHLTLGRAALYAAILDWQGSGVLTAPLIATTDSGFQFAVRRAEDSAALPGTPIRVCLYRIPKSECRNGLEHPGEKVLRDERLEQELSGFGLRISFGPRISDFRNSFSQFVEPLMTRSSASCGRGADFIQVVQPSFPVTPSFTSGTSSFRSTSCTSNMNSWPT